MKKFLLTLMVLSGLFSASALFGTERLPTIGAEVEVSQYADATECYVLFLLESTGGSLQDAKAKFDLKRNHFMKLVHKDFPGLKSDVISVNVGSRDFSSYRAEERSFCPNIAKVLLFTLPPDENMALKLLDAGVKSGLTPFCGTSRDDTFGAVFYGLKNADAEIDKLYPRAVPKLRTQADRLARELGREVVRMVDISRFFPREEPYELRFKNIKVPLPGGFCASDKNKIKVSLILRANFAVKKKIPFDQAGSVRRAAPRR